MGKEADSDWVMIIDNMQIKFGEAILRCDLDLLTLNFYSTSDVLSCV